MSDENERAILIVDRPLCCRDVIGQRCEWILYGYYIETFSLE
jgi:hypothetical protein